MSLYRRHIISVVAAFFVAAGLFSWFNYGITQKYIEDVKKQRVELLSEVVTNGLKSIMLEGKPKEEFQRFLDGLAAEDIRAVRIFSDSGIILGSTVPGEMGQRVDDLHMQAFRSRKGPSLFIHKHEGNKVYSSLVVMSNDWPCQRCHGSSDDIRAIVDLEVMQEKVDTSVTGALLWTVITHLGIVALLSLAIIFISRYQISRPLRRIAGEIMAIARGNATARVSAYRDEELEAVSSAVNRIAADLEKARETVGRYESRETSQLEKMASIGEVAATVAHEIKNPLAGISGALQVMAEDIPDDSPRKEICNEILSEIDRLDRSVKELIAYARPQEINPMPVDLNVVAGTAVDNVRKVAETMGIRVLTSAGPLPVVKADPEQVGKVLRDIMLYQIQLMPDGGTISVCSSYNQMGNEIELISSDTANAMPDEKIRNIFRPSFSTKYTGSGLGLAVGRNIIESHGGRIRVESEPGIGNSFHIIMPVER